MINGILPLIRASPDLQEVKKEKYSRSGSFELMPLEIINSSQPRQWQRVLLKSAALPWNDHHFSKEVKEQFLPAKPCDIMLQESLRLALFNGCNKLRAPL